MKARAEPYTLDCALQLYLLLLFLRVLLSWFPAFGWDKQPWLALRQVAFVRSTSNACPQSSTGCFVDHSHSLSHWLCLHTLFEKVVEPDVGCFIWELCVPWPPFWTWQQLLGTAQNHHTIC